ncbi:DUF1289 domain-containing protein [Thalassotalea piscium]|uniref:DUF1289 domain-containing protein n=1 Tax=Thalassotalea piscium TaxID=1230533 RepID=UPI0016208866|nr:DUF1289 domain-containing protein [Thalassotalea piscium]
MTTDRNTNLSPCIGKCCLNNDDVCLGCFRLLSEITHWRELDEDQQREILVHCEKRKINNKQ